MSNTTIFSNSIEVISAQAEFGASTITLVDPSPVPTHLTYAQAEPDVTADPVATPLPCTPTPEPTHTPARPHLTIAPDSDTEEGEIVSRVHRHNYPLSPQSSLNVMQGHPELDAVIRCSTGCTRIPTGAENRSGGDRAERTPMTESVGGIPLSSQTRSRDTRNAPNEAPP